MYEWKETVKGKNRSVRKGKLTPEIVKENKEGMYIKGIGSF